MSEQKETWEIIKARGYWGRLSDSQREQLELDFEGYAEGRVTEFTATGAEATLRCLEALAREGRGSSVFWWDEMLRVEVELRVLRGTVADKDKLAYWHPVRGPLTRAEALALLGGWVKVGHIGDGPPMKGAT